MANPTTGAPRLQEEEVPVVSISSGPPPSESASLLRRAVQRVQAYTPPIHVRSTWEEFMDFMQQGNMIDLAIGLILGKAFTDIINSFVVDILSPTLSLFSERSLANYYAVARCPTDHKGCNSTSWETSDQARDAGAITINYGLFLENVVNFVIYALFLYIAIKKVFEVFFNRSVNTLKQCPICKELVKGGALVCKNCGNKF